MSDRCQHLLRGSGLPCNTRFYFDTDQFGRVRAHCGACLRNAQGLCRDCPATIAVTSHWCANCKQRRRREAYHANPALRIAKRKHRRQWVKRNRKRAAQHARDYAARNPNRYKLRLAKQLTGRAA